MNSHWVSFKHCRCDIWFDFKINDKNQYIQIRRSGTEKFIDEKIGLVLPANSPYLTLFNTEIYRMLQMGFIQKWMSEFLTQKDRCSSKASSMEIENHTVNLLDMQGCFLVLLAGNRIRWRYSRIIYKATFFVLWCFVFQASLRLLLSWCSSVCAINIKYWMKQNLLNLLSSKHQNIVHGLEFMRHINTNKLSEKITWKKKS